MVTGNLTKNAAVWRAPQCTPSRSFFQVYENRRKRLPRWGKVKSLYFHRTMVVVRRTMIALKFAFLGRKR